MRLSATKALLERDDVIIIASDSNWNFLPTVCIFGYHKGSILNTLNHYEHSFSQSYQS
jgi:excinuclease UvrABC helicase subunit UvrB